MHPALESWTPDEVAECLEVSDSTYKRLWELLESIDPINRVPLGGDGTNGTVEYPPEPDSYPTGRMGAIWDKLTPAEQQEINAAIERTL